MSAFSLPSIFPVANADQVANHQKSVPGGDSSRAMPVGAGTRIFQPALGQQPSETVLHWRQIQWLPRNSACCLSETLSNNFSWHDSLL